MPERGLFDGGSEMGELMRRHDWSRTPLGRPEAWPRSLRTVVKILLTSRYAMWMGWGPDLTFLYNDAYGSMTLGAKHPWALGRPSREVWAEIWPQIGPRITKVLTTGEATWDERLMLFLERSGYREETYHTFSYSPLPDDDGLIRGHLCVVTEETERVIDERHLATLKELGSHLAQAKTEDEVIRASESAVAADMRDLPFTAIYLFGPDQRATLASVTGIDESSPLPAQIDVTELARAWGLPASDREGIQVLPAPAFATWIGKTWDKPVSDVFVVPIRQTGQVEPAGLFIAGANPYRAIGDKYRSFVNLYVGQLTAGLASARAFEEERRRAEALAEIDRAKTAFFSNVSHEFRTPLTLILGPTEDALKAPDGALRGEDLRTVYRNELRLLRLVNALLDFSRIEAGRMRALFEPVDLAELTSDLAGVFRSAVERGGMRLEVDCPPIGQPVYVDRQMWEKVVLNLLSNAFKFTFEGTIRVSLRSEDSRVVLRVSDTGIGISADDQPRVFERFHRIEGTRARTHEGSGIGLALVHDLVGLHGGTIGVDSEVGRGSTFIVTLRHGTAHLSAGRVGAQTRVGDGEGGDAVYAAEEAARWLTGERAVAGAAASSYAPAETPISGEGHILIVDDNADMREYMTRLLSARWPVEAVSDGLSALASVRRQRPSLVLSDVMMPGLDGFGLLRELRQDPATRTIPVIMLSARAGEDSRIEGLEAGADDYLVKPFSARELLARVSARLDLHRLGERLEQERASLADLFHQMPVPVAVLRGPNLVFEMANSAYVESIGYRDPIGKTFSESLPELDAQGIGSMLLEVLKTGVARTGRDVMVRVERGGVVDEAYWTFICSPLRGESGKYDRVVAICNEVSDQVRARQKLESLTAASVSASRAKDEFLAMLGHELRNPLAPIMTALQLMQLKGASQVEKERTIIERQTRHLVRLVDDLLDVSRIARGKIALKKEPINVAPIVARAIELASPLFEARAQRLDVDVPATGLIVIADPERLAQAIANLLTNAAKYTGVAGQIVVRASREHGDVVVVVRDNGIGIQPDMLPRVFELFVQERQALDRSEGGLGLGLTIVRNIMLLHGGSASVHSEGLGRGSEFTLRLPIAAAVPATLVGADPEIVIARSAPAGYSILVVDDNEDAAALLAETLAMRGHEVRMALDGPEALAIVNTFLPAVALLDLGLPGMDGYELAERLRTNSRLSEMKLVAITGYGQPTDRQRAMTAGFHAHVVKPVEIDYLDAIIRDVVD